MRLILKVILSLILVVSTAWSQEKTGPHQGYIQSTGSYNLELLFEKNGLVKVYLLDSELKNETVKASEVGAFIKSGNVESELTCVAKEETHFECQQHGKVFHKGELLVSSKRDGVRSEEIKIKIPFDQKK